MKLKILSLVGVTIPGPTPDAKPTVIERGDTLAEIEVEHAQVGALIQTLSGPGAVVARAD